MALMPPQANAMAAMGPPPIIPGLTQLPPERMEAVMNMMDGGPSTLSMEKSEGNDVLPRLMAAITQVFLQAADDGPDTFELVSTMAKSLMTQFKKQMAERMSMGGGEVPPLYDTAPGVRPMPGEDSHLPFMNQMMSGGR